MCARAHACLTPAHVHKCTHTYVHTHTQSRHGAAVSTSDLSAPTTGERAPFPRAVPEAGRAGPGHEPAGPEGRKPRGARAQRARPRQGSARADSTLRDSRRREARPCGAVGEPGAAGGRAPPLVRAMGTAPRAAGRPPRGRRAAKCVEQHTSRTPRLRQASYASDGAGGTCPSSAL